MLKWSSELIFRGKKITSSYNPPVPFWEWLVTYMPKSQGMVIFCVNRFIPKLKIHWSAITSSLFNFNYHCHYYFVQSIVKNCIGYNYININFGSYHTDEIKVKQFQHLFCYLAVFRSRGEAQNNGGRQWCIHSFYSKKPS